MDNGKIGIQIQTNLAAGSQKRLQDQLDAIAKRLTLNIGKVKILSEQFKTSITKANQELKTTASLAEKAANSENRLAEIQIKLAKSLEASEKRRRQDELKQQKTIESVNKEKEKQLKYEQSINYTIEKRNKIAQQQKVDQSARTNLSLYNQKNRELNAGASFGNSTSALQNRIDTLSSRTFISPENLQSITTLQNRLNQLSSTFAKIGTATPQYRQQLAELNNEYRRINSSVIAANKSGYDFGTMLTQGIKKMAIWTIAATAFYAPVRAFQQALETLKEIDTQLVDIAKVTNLTKQEMQSLAKEGTKIASTLGRTTQDYLQSVAEFSRAGYGESAKDLAKSSLLLQNVGDISSKTANEMLLAVDAAYQLGGSQEALTKVIDQVNIVSNNNATSVEKMAEGMTVAASIFNQAGVPIEDFIALVGTATAVTQRSGSEISRGLRTVILNLQGVTDAELEVTEESISMAEEILNKYGIVVRDSANQFKAPMAVFEDIANKFKTTLKENEIAQSEIIQRLAGKRQANIFSAVINNWDMVEKQIGETLNATGSAMQENEKVMDSWQAKSNQLANSITAFWQQSLNTDLIKGFIDTLKSMVDWFTKAGGLIPIVAGLLTGALTAGIMAVKAGVTILNVELSYTNILLGGLPIIIGLVTAGVTGLAFHTGVLGEKTSFANAQTLEFIESSNKEAKATDKLIKEYEDLNKKYDEAKEKGEDVLGIKQSMTKIMGELKNLYPGYISEVNAETDAYKVQIGVIKELNEKKKQQIRQDAELFLAANKTKIDEAKNQQQIYENVSSAYHQKKIKPYEVSAGKYKITEDSEYFQKAMGSASLDSIRDTGIIAQGVTSLKQKSEEAQKIIDEAEMHEALIQAVLSSDWENPLSGQLVYGGYENAKDKTSGGVISDKSGKNNSDKSSPYRSEFNIPDKFLQQDKFKDLNDTIDSVNEALRENQAIMENTPEKEQIDLLEKRIKLEEDLKTALHNKAEAVRQERSDIEKTLTDNKLGLNFSGIGDDRKITNATWAAESLGKWVDEVRENPDPKIHKDREAYAKFIIGEMERYNVGSGKDINSAQVDWLGALKGQNDSKSKIQDAKDDAFSKILDSYGKSANKLDNELTVLEGTMSELDNDDLVKKLEIQNQLISKSEEVVKAYEEELYKLNFLTPKSEKQTEDWKKKQQELNDKFASAKKNLSGYRKEIKATTEDIKEQAKEAISSYVSYLKDQTNDRIDAIDKEKDTYIDAKNAEIDAIEKKIDALDRENDAIDEQIQKTELLDKLAKAKEKVANVEKEKDVRIFQDGKFVWSVNPNDLREANEELADVQKDYTEWERENTLKHKKQTLQDEIDAKRELIRTKELWAKTEQDKLRLQLTELDNITKLSNDNQITSYDQLISKLGELGNKAETELNRVKAAQAALSGMGVSVGSISSGGGSSTSKPSAIKPADMPMNNPAVNRANDAILAANGLPTSNTPLYRTFDTGGLLRSGTVGVNTSGENEYVMKPDVARSFIGIMDQLPQISSVFDRIFSGVSPTIPNFNRVGNSSMSNDNSIRIDNINVTTNNAYELINGLKRLTRSS
jgi:TP901 family phage tail tape measure protein